MEKPGAFHWWMAALAALLLLGIGVLLWGLGLGRSVTVRLPGAAAQMIRRLSLG